jgi:hypothetical protein
MKLKLALKPGIVVIAALVTLLGAGTQPTNASETDRTAQVIQTARTKEPDPPRPDDKRRPKPKREADVKLAFVPRVG